MIIGIIALAFSIISPFIFNAYIEEKPDELEKTLIFGGPFPFAEQTLTLPEDKNSYPAIIDFESPMDEKTAIKWIPLLLTFMSYFLLFFSIYSIIARFINGRPTRKEKEDKPE